MKFALLLTTIVAFFDAYYVFHVDGAGNKAQHAGASGSGHDEAPITTDSQDTESKRLNNYLRMLKLRDMATPVLLNIFRKRWARLMELKLKPENTGKNWLDGRECGERLVKICTDNAIPITGIMKKKIGDGDTAEWDVTLVLSVIHAVTKSIKKIQKGLNMNSSPFNEEDRHIRAIGTVRNIIAHTSKSELTEDKFEPLWQKMTNALVGLGVAKTEMEKTKTKDFTATTINAQSEADQIKAKANAAFSAGRYEEAIDHYARILRIEGLSADYQAVIYSNRSAVYLRQADNGNDAGSLSKAIQDAKITIQMRPTWWRGYHRLGMAYKSKGKLEKALEQLETALALEPPQDWRKKIREEVSALRHQIGIQSNDDDLAPYTEINAEEEWFDAEESMDSSSSKSQNIGFQIPDDYNQNVPALKAAAEKGSKQALEVLSIWQYKRDAMDAFKSGDHQKMVQQLAKAIRMDNQLAKVPKLFKPIMEKRLLENPDELDTIVCYIKMNEYKLTMKKVFKFVEEWFKKFPKDLFLMEMHAIGLIRKYEQYGKAIELVEEALKFYPNNVRLLFLRAMFYSKDLKANSDATNKAWDDFLAVAPEDHRKVPAAYYRKGLNFINIDDEITKSVEFFENGLAAEKKMLPCFLPYNVSEKHQLEKIYTLGKSKQLVLALNCYCGGTKMVDWGKCKKCANCKMSMYCTEECWKESKQHKLLCEHLYLDKYRLQIGAAAADNLAVDGDGDVKASTSGHQDSDNNHASKEPTREDMENRPNCVIM